MSVEIEYKFKLEEPISDFVAKLQSLNLEVDERLHELTVMFDNPFEIMQITDGRIRLRKSGNKVTISYKKPLPKVDGQPKQEIEYETIVGDFNVMANILKTMDFNEKSSYEKFRTKVKCKNSEITIDEYPFATFVEIEGEEGEITEIANDLGFDLNKHFNKHADSLFNEWRASQGLPNSLHMKFDNYNV